MTAKEVARSITSPAAASSSASAPAGTARRWRTTAPIRARGCALMAERIEAMKAIWTQDEASYNGEFVNFDRIWSWPKPLQRPHPPVLVGGNGPTVLDRVLAFGDALVPNYSSERHRAHRRAARASGAPDRGQGHQRARRTPPRSSGWRTRARAARSTGSRRRISACVERGARALGVGDRGAPRRGVSPEEARERFAAARVARLATADRDGRPHIVPIVFALDGDRIYSAVDQKPKRTTALRRLANIARQPERVVARRPLRGRLGRAVVGQGRRTRTRARARQRRGTARRRRCSATAIPSSGRRGAVLAVDVERWSGWSAT